jgi:hypothetical protein
MNGLKALQNIADIKGEQLKKKIIEDLELRLHLEAKTLRPTAICGLAYKIRELDRESPYRYYGLRVLQNAIKYIRNQRSIDEEKQFWSE